MPYLLVAASRTPMQARMSHLWVLPELFRLLLIVGCSRRIPVW